MSKFGELSSLAHLTEPFSLDIFATGILSFSIINFELFFVGHFVYGHQYDSRTKVWRKLELSS